MPSTPTQNLRLELQATGENANTWGGKLNTLFQLVENALTKRTPLVLSNTNVTLSTTNFADDQARNLCLACSGVLTGNVDIIVPDLSHFYLVENACTGAFDLRIKTAAGDAVTLPPGETTIVYVNGTDCVLPNAGAQDASTLDGLDSSAFAQLAVFNQFAQGSGHTFNTLTDGVTITLDAELSDRFIVTLAGNRTLDVTNPSDGQEIQLWVVQDGGGSRTLALPANFVFENGLSPTLSTAAGGLDVLKFTYNLARDQFVCEAILGTGAASSIGIVLTANEVDVDIFTRAGSPGASTTVNVIVQTGVVVKATTTATPALDFRGFANGTVVNLINLGYILGKGGDGGDGAGASNWRDAPNPASGTIGADDGFDGGPAIVGPGAGRTFNITNGSGFIWGGGGGGGGGGAATGFGGSNNAGGGGGGGGNGGGAAGRSRAFRISPTTGGSGSPGGTGPNGVVGTGGTGLTAGGGVAGNGGNGGDWGSDGDDGSTAAGTEAAAEGGGGAAGAAVDQNGGVANFVSGASNPHVKGALV